MLFRGQGIPSGVCSLFTKEEQYLKKDPDSVLRARLFGFNVSVPWSFEREPRMFSSDDNIRLSKRSQQFSVFLLQLSSASNYHF